MKVHQGQLPPMYPGNIECINIHDVYQIGTNLNAIPKKSHTHKGKKKENSRHN